MKSAPKWLSCTGKSSNTPNARSWSYRGNVLCRSVYKKVWKYKRLNSENLPPWDLFLDFPNARLRENYSVKLSAHFGHNATSTSGPIRDQSRQNTLADDQSYQNLDTFDQCLQYCGYCRMKQYFRTSTNDANWYIVS